MNSEIMPSDFLSHIRNLMVFPLIPNDYLKKHSLLIWHLFLKEWGCNFTLWQAKTQNDGSRQNKREISMFICWQQFKTTRHIFFNSKSDIRYPYAPLTCFRKSLSYRSLAEEALRMPNTGFDGKIWLRATRTFFKC